MQKLYMYLTTLGVVPFVVCTVLLVYGTLEVACFGSVHKLQSAYSVIIFSFILGSYWGLHFSANGVLRILLPLISNVLAVGVWLAYVIMPFNALMCSLSVLFVVLLVLDYHLLKAYLLPFQYVVLRACVTFVVSGCLMVSGVYGC